MRLTALNRSEAGFDILNNADLARPLITWNERQLGYPKMKVHKLVCTNVVRQTTLRILSNRANQFSEVGSR